MILTKNQLISDTRNFSHGMLLEIQRENRFALLDITIIRIMQVYNQCATDCLKSSTLRQAKKSKEILALTSLLRACAGYLLSPDAKYVFIKEDGSDMTNEGASMYNLYDTLVDITIEYIGPNTNLLLQHKEISDHINNLKHEKTKKSFSNEKICGTPLYKK